MAQATNLEEKPEITIPEGAPPAELTYEELVAGDGAEAGPGAAVTVHYVGVQWSNGEQFDSSWDRGKPATFSLDQVIPGWTIGLGGDQSGDVPPMRVGGRRQLVIPPDLAYGDTPPPGIEPGATLVFVVDLLDVQAPAGGDGATP